MAFRLLNFQIEDDNLNTSKIELVDNKRDKGENYFSLLVGNNGSGKSRILGSITKALIGKYKRRKSDLFYYSDFETTIPPSKVIALSNSLSDKFPLDNTFQSTRYSGDLSYRKERYNYLGTRGKMGASPRQMMRKAIDILLENYANNKISKSYRHVFDYLDYKPVIKLEYRIIHREISNNPKGIIEPNDVIEYVNKRSNYRSINQRTFETFEEIYGNRLDEICDFLNNLRFQNERNYELEIDFSSSNIRRISRDNSLYEEDIRIYELLNILRKLNMIKGFDVRVYKKDGEEFNFGEASSGEANILTMMISLIPLIEDNCCVLIDEPEISLHPSWQYRYIGLLINIFETFKGCHIIIASHSHFLVSDLPINYSSVITLQKEKGAISSQILPNSTFGWSAEDILLNIFDMPTSRNYYLSNIVTEALELLADENRSNERFLELKGVLKEVAPKLKDEDPLKTIIKTIIGIRNE